MKKIVLTKYLFLCGQNNDGGGGGVGQNEIKILKLFSCTEKKMKVEGVKESTLIASNVYKLFVIKRN